MTIPFQPVIERIRHRPGAVLTAGLLGLAVLVGASRADDQQEATRLRQAGEILPLQQLLEHFEPGRSARILEVELKQRHGGYVYEIEFLDTQGRVQEHRYDAVTGELLRARQEH